MYARTGLGLKSCQEGHIPTSGVLVDSLTYRSRERSKRTTWTECGDLFVFIKCDVRLPTSSNYLECFCIARQGEYKAMTQAIHSIRRMIVWISKYWLIIKIEFLILVHGDETIR